MEESIIGCLIFISFIFLIAELSSTKNKLNRVESKLNLLLESNGIAINDKDFVPAEVQYALKSGKKIKAIRLYREHTGTSFLEAQKAVNGFIAARD
ncbi:hypothetical protein Q4557_06465 [Shewanella sp. 5_MG-2023]|uniref:hypothetical protein n=1 Tax=unclassified Shewanella TaxID=196818 RepID=UPI000C820560|nr:MULTISPECIES: hypothetical protein [unclassified Shewanella]MDO6639600.1 hypothetical protein [Shewanella sp. 5_MG-2023]PMG72289.1 hypothetical protein BCU84_19905 [Shewanella sp. 10N.286.51.B7]